MLLEKNQQHRFNVNDSASWILFPVTAHLYMSFTRLIMIFLLYFSGDFSKPKARPGTLTTYLLNEATDSQFTAYCNIYNGLKAQFVMVRSFGENMTSSCP